MVARPCVTGAGGGGGSLPGVSVVGGGELGCGAAGTLGTSHRLRSCPRSRLRGGEMLGAAVTPGAVPGEVSWAWEARDTGSCGPSGTTAFRRLARGPAAVGGLVQRMCRAVCGKAGPDALEVAMSSNVAWGASRWLGAERRAPARTPAGRAWVAKNSSHRRRNSVYQPCASSGDGGMMVTDHRMWWLGRRLGLGGTAWWLTSSSC